MRTTTRPSGQVKEYAARPESESPHERERRRGEQARAMTAELLAATPAWRRPAARALLALAARRILLRGVGKRSFVQSIDVCRAAARWIGRCLVEDGVLDDVEDVFLLCFDEILDGPPSDARRRRRRAQHEALRIPGNWSGNPDATPVTQDDAEAHGDTVRGIGVSSGVVEGRVRVVTRSDFAEVLPDEVLVAPTTDPSWSPIMFVSSALVVDIGGALSHAAVVARELGLPCVVNTRTGTRALRTGDLVRVDGAVGTVHVLPTGRRPDPGRHGNRSDHTRNHHVSTGFVVHPVDGRDEGAHQPPEGAADRWQESWGLFWYDPHTHSGGTTTPGSTRTSPTSTSRPTASSTSWDWQFVSKSHWAHDVAFFLICSLSVEERREHEQDLLREYLKLRSGRGGEAPSWDEAWRDYRIHTLHGLRYALTPNEMQPAEVRAPLSERFAQALLDHDSYGLLGV